MDTDPSGQIAWRRRAHHVQTTTQNLAHHHTRLDPTWKERGFGGWHSRGYLPHFDRPDLLQSVTFRVIDTLPPDQVQRLRELPDSPTKRRLSERWLDQSPRNRWLQIPELAECVENALLHFDGDRYQLCAWCIMPNHVHALLEITTWPLRRILQTWKGYTGREANRMLGRRGAFWESEYWDRYIRDVRHYHAIVRYIEQNPVQARLTGSSDPRTWPWSSARRRPDKWVDPVDLPHGTPR